MSDSIYESLKGTTLKATGDDFGDNTTCFITPCTETPNSRHSGEEKRRYGSSKECRIDRETIRSHVSTPVTEVFARNAAPLYLPALDKSLERYPRPSLIEPTRLSGTLFPPLDRLAAAKKSIKDLEYNNIINPGWKNRASILGSIVNIALAITGSSAVAKFYGLHGLIDTVQIFALVLNSIARPTEPGVYEGWKELIFGTIPNVLALNFHASLAYLLFFMFATSLLLWYFWHATRRCKPEDANEGLQLSVPYTGSWRLIFVCFILSVIYLPLSTIAVHAIVWSSDFWANRSDESGSVPLGPANEFRDSTDICYTTTMKRNEINLAPIVFIASVFTFTALTIWFPFRLRKTIRQALPVVEKYTELGTLRSTNEMDREYQRLLDRDRGPLAFLYQDFRRGWGTYKSFYLFAKLSALLVISIFNPDNCIFRSLPRAPMSITREAILVCAMLGFFLLQCFIAPFVHPVDNASEWVSRLNYLLTALIGLAIAAGAPGKSVLQGPILMIVYISTYGLSAYFTVINFSWMHRLVKRLTGRIDFSLDIFSPRLDVSPQSIHVTRRIWQEALSVVFLTSTECKIPSGQRMQFTSSRDASCPPYLLDFLGSPSERHVENLKILREVGMERYEMGISILETSQQPHFRHVFEQIQRFYIGPDSYWRDPSDTTADLVTSFGNSWWTPFPPALVMRFDDGRIAVLDSIEQFSWYLEQNQNPDVKRSKELRLALRSLNGLKVQWEYEHRVPSHDVFSLCLRSCLPRRAHAYRIEVFCSCTFKLSQRGDLIYKGVQLSSGFDVELVYSPKIRLTGDDIGIEQDFRITPTLARFVSLNKAIIQRRLPVLQTVIQSYRDHYWYECRAKAEVLSYKFLVSVYNKPLPFSLLSDAVRRDEHDSRVRRLFQENEDTLLQTYERLTKVLESPVSTWWYIFWDDLWRRNHSTIKGLETHERDFNPHYPSSIAYTPMPRASLEIFLSKRGLLSAKARRTDFFHSGFLNKVYLRMNDLVFNRPSKTLAFHVGRRRHEVDFDEIDQFIPKRTSSLGTGGGTDHDDISIRARPNYRWEELFENSPSQNKTRLRRWIQRLGVWFGLTPYWRNATSDGLTLDVILENGNYIKLPRYNHE